MVIQYYLFSQKHNFFKLGTSSKILLILNLFDYNFIKRKNTYFRIRECLNIRSKCRTGFSSLPFSLYYQYCFPLCHKKNYYMEEKFFRCRNKSKTELIWRNLALKLDRSKLGYVIGNRCHFQ